MTDKNVSKVILVYFFNLSTPSVDPLCHQPYHYPTLHVAFVYKQVHVINSLGHRASSRHTSETRD